MALDFKDFLVAFMFLIIILLVLDRMYQDAKYGGYGQMRKLNKEEYIKKHGSVNRNFVQMPRWDDPPPVPESMKRDLQKEEKNDSEETAHFGRSSHLEQSVSREQVGDPERDSSRERRQSFWRDFENRSDMDR